MVSASKLKKFGNKSLIICFVEKHLDGHKYSTLLYKYLAIWQSKMSKKIYAFALSLSYQYPGVGKSILLKIESCVIVAMVKSNFFAHHPSKKSIVLRPDPKQCGQNREEYFDI